MIATRYENDEILILDKPAGLAVQPGAGVSLSLIDVVEKDLGFKPYLVHRLDKETSGLIIVAKDSRSASHWTEAIGGRRVAKDYRAIVAGRLPAAQGRLTEPVRVKGELVPADTAYKVIATGSFEVGGSEEPLELSHLELRLGTGRTHQIRQHLAQAKAPILGDDLHGDFALNKRLRKAWGLKRLFLFAWRLELPDGTPVTASIPEHFGALFARLPELSGAPS